MSKPPLVLMRRFLLPFAMLGLLASTGCASLPPPLTINIPPILREPCPRPDAANVETVGDLAAFSVRQEADLAVCNDRRQALVDIIDAHGRLVAPRPWYRRVFHR